MENLPCKKTVKRIGQMTELDRTLKNEYYGGEKNDSNRFTDAEFSSKGHR